MALTAFLALGRVALGEPDVQAVDFTGHKLVRVEVKSVEQLHTLDAIAEIWNCHVGVGPLEASLPPERLAELDAAGLAYTVLDDDIGPESSQHLTRVRGAGPFDNYMTFDEIVAFINGLATARPDLCEVIDIGNSIEGRDIWVLHITGAGAGPKPAVFYHGLQHAREWITGPTVLYLADHLVNNYDTDPCITDLVDRTDIYLAPCVNPDGYSYTWTNNRLWRKNRRNNGSNFGVDLNRNWGYQWGINESGSSSVTSSEVYRGTGPFSEPETTALSNFVLAHPSIRAYMDYHSYSQLLLWPWGYACLDLTEPDASTFDALGTEMQRLIGEVHGVNYVAGPICQTLYDANGSSVDWVYGSADRYGFTIELRPGSNSPIGFELPPDQIIPTCEENLPAILHLTRSASDGITVSFAGGPPAQVATGEPAAMSVQIAEAFETYVAGSGAVHYRYAPTAPFATVPLAPSGGGSYTASIPAGPCGATLEYYVTAESSGGVTVTVPCDAPASTFSAEVVGAAVLMADELEGPSTNWTVGDTGDNALTGVWVRVDPNGTAAQPADDHTPAPGTMCFVTGQGPVGGGVGDNDVDSGTTTLKSPTLDLSAEPDASIGYWRWYSNTAGAAPNADIFVVHISNDDGGSWVTLETVGPTGPETSGGWYYREFAVADFLPPTSQVRVRFVASDLGSGSIVEAAVDDFQVIRTGCASPPGDADGDGDVDAADYAYFVDCMGGPGAAVPGTCQMPHSVFDLDADADIDLGDFSALQAASAP